MKTVLFCRVSSKDQEETGYSLPSQERLLKEYSTGRGFEIDQIFSISESASGHRQRKTFLEMLEYLKKKKIKALVVEKTDRLTRNMRDAVAINSWIEDDDEKQVHFVKENFVLSRNSKSNDKFIWGIKVTTAQYYLDNLSEEVKKGQKEKIAQGWLPTKPPLGYRTIGDKGRKTHVVDEVEGPLVKKMFDLYATGNYSIKKLSDVIYDYGLRSVNGKRIQKSRIHRLLTDPFYVGRMVWNKAEYDGNQETLIDQDVFDKVNRVLKSKHNPKYSKHEYLFKGMFKCKECHGTITWEEHKGHIYGHCNHYRNCKQNKWAKEEDVENNLTSILDKLQVKDEDLANWLSKALKEANQEDSSFYLASVEELNNKRVIIKNRLDNIYIDKIDGKISEDYYNEKFNDFSKILKGIDKKISEQTLITNKTTQYRANMFDVAQTGRETYNKANVMKKRELLRQIFNNLMLEGEGKIYSEFTESFTLLSELIEKTNGSKLAILYKNDRKTFELNTLPKLSELYATLEPSCSVLLPALESIRTCFIK